MQLKEGFFIELSIFLKNPLLQIKPFLEYVQKNIDSDYSGFFFFPSFKCFYLFSYSYIQI